MTANVPGIVSVAVFYVAILVVGIIAGKKTSNANSKKSILIADRNLGLMVSIFTFTATLVGGGYINGTAEKVSKSGILQTPAPIGYCLSLVIAAFTYCPKMRANNYITMFDPFALKWGRKTAGLLFIVQLIGDLFWCAATLSALGACMKVILDIPNSLAVVISATVAVAYTFMGGLYSVAYTDVIQLAFIAFGLILAVPFAWTSPIVDMDKVTDSGSWEGEIKSYDIGSWLDKVLLCIFGGIPWQAFFQRALACRDVFTSKVSCLVGGLFALSLGIPPMLIGIAGQGADWNATTLKKPMYVWDEDKNKTIHNWETEDFRYMLPYGLQYLCPLPVGIIGMGAMAAAVMSSADSTILSSASVFAKNVWQDIMRPKCSSKELSWVLRISIVVFGVMATLIAVFSNTTYGLYLLCSDLMYVIMFPQLTIVLWNKSVNAYGSITGYFVSFLLRVLAGEPVIGWPTIIKYPGFDEIANKQYFPHRTFAMLVGVVLMYVVSWLTNKLFIEEIVSRKYDFLQCHRQKTIEMRYDEGDEEESNDVMLTTTTGNGIKA